MRFGIIGTNFISDWFCDAIDELRSRGEDVESYAVYSRTAKRGEEFASLHGIAHVYDDYGKMLADKNIDAVYVASPTFKHAEQSILALKAGKHVLCEKMMAHTLEAFLEMKACAKESGLVLLEAMRPEFDPSLGVIKDAIKEIGKVRRSSFVFLKYSSRYDDYKSGKYNNTFDPSIYNSALADIGIYPLHMAVSLFGEPRGVSTKGIFLENGFLGAGEIFLDYGDHICTVSYSKISDSLSPSVIDGEGGSVSIDKITAPSRIACKPVGEDERVLEYDHAPNKINMIYEIKAFSEMVRSMSDRADEYLRITEICQRIVDEVYTALGAKLG